MTTKLTCPKCGDELTINQGWRLVKPWKLETVIQAGESLQGDYAHEDCV